MAELSIIIIADEIPNNTIFTAESIFLNESKIENKKIIIVDMKMNEAVASFAEKYNIGYVYQENADEHIGKTLNEVIEYFEIDTDICFFSCRGGFFDTHNALWKMQEIVTSDKNFGIVGGMSNLYEGIQKYDRAESYDEMVRLSDILNGISAIRTVCIEPNIFVCSRQVLSELGEFDTDYDSVESIFKDYIFRAITQKFGIGYCCEALIWGITYEKIPFRSDEQLFRAKYGTGWINSRYSESIISCINVAGNESFNVLELNCGCGANLAEIKNRYCFCNVFGVEKEKVYADIASGLATVTMSGINEYNLPYEKKHFKYIIVDGWKNNTNNIKELLGYYQKYLTDDGKIITRIPNSLYISRLNSIIEGNSKCVEEIFALSLDEIKDILKKSGFYINSVYCNKRTTSVTEKERINGLLKTYPDREEADFETVDYVVMASWNYTISFPPSVIDKLSALSYKGIYPYRYVVDMMTLYDNEEWVKKDCMLSAGRGEVVIKGEQKEARKKIDALLDSLSQCDLLVFNTINRKVKGGEAILTVLDPYLDCYSDYLLLDFSDRDVIGDASLHTKNLKFLSYDDVLLTYGLDEVEYEELELFAHDKMFSIIKEYFGRDYHQSQKESIIAQIYYVLRTRRAFISFYKEVLCVVKPKAIMYSHGRNYIMCLLYEAAKMLNIPCIEISHGASKNSCYSYPDTSKCNDEEVVYSDIFVEEAKECGGVDIVSIGKPFISEQCCNYRMPEGEGVIVSVISSDEPWLLEMACQLSEILDPSKYRVLYKLHSSEIVNEIHDIFEKFPRLSLISGDVDIFEMFENSQIIIGYRSTALLEALVFEKIKIILTGDYYVYTEGRDYSFFGKVIENGEMVHAETIEDVISEIKNYRKGKNYRANGEIFWKKNSEIEFKEYIDKKIKNSPSDGKL